MVLVQSQSGVELLMVVTGSQEGTGSCAGLTPTKRKRAAKERGKKRCHI